MILDFSMPYMKYGVFTFTYFNFPIRKLMDLGNRYDLGSHRMRLDIGLIKANIHATITEKAENLANLDLALCLVYLF